MLDGIDPLPAEPSEKHVKHVLEVDDAFTFFKSYLKRMLEY